MVTLHRQAQRLVSMPTSRRLHAALLCGVATLVPLTAEAQSSASVDPSSLVACQGKLKHDAPGVCVGTLASGDQVQLFDIQLRFTSRPLVGRRVVFKANAGALTRDTVYSDEDGVVRTSWYRTGSSSDVGIAVDLPIGTGSSLLYIRLSPRDQALVLEKVQSPSKQRYATATGSEIVLQVRAERSVDAEKMSPLFFSDTGGVDSRSAVIDRKLCSSIRVAFSSRSAGAVISPDTAVGFVYGSGDASSVASGATGCFVSTDWRLGTQPGKQQLVATGLSAAGYRFVNPRITYEVKARRLPQFVLGAAAFVHESYITRRNGTAPGIRVERVLADGSKVSYDSAATAAIDTLRSGTGALVGAMIPIPSTGGLSVALAADIVAPRTTQYVGFSVGEWISGLPSGFPLDVLVLARVEKIEVLENPALCQSSGLADACGTKSRRRWGPTIALSVDAGTFVSEVIKKIAN